MKWSEVIWNWKDDCLGCVTGLAGSRSYLDLASSADAAAQ